MRRLVGITALFGLALGLWVAPTSAGGLPPELGVGPASGTVFTWFSVFGDQCPPGDDPGSWGVYAEPGDSLLAAGGVSPEEDATWEDGFPGWFLPGPGTYRVEADCPDQEFEYDPVTFTVTDAPTDPTLTVTPLEGTVDDAYDFLGTACPQGPQGGENGDWELYRDETDEQVAAGPTAPDDAGEWRDGFPAGTWPFGPGDFRLEADCPNATSTLDRADVAQGFDYAPVVFTVLDVPPTTPPADEPTAAAPAQAMPGQATLTG